MLNCKNHVSMAHLRYKIDTKGYKHFEFRFENKLFKSNLTNLIFET